MKKILLYLLLSGISFFSAKAQSIKYFSKSDSRDSARITYVAVENVEDGYVASGYYEYVVPGQSQLNCYGYVVKFDFDGNIKWRRLLQKGDSLVYYLGLSVINNFIYSSNAVAKNNNGYSFIIKINGITGDTVWIKEYKGLSVSLSAPVNFKDHILYSRGYGTTPDSQVVSIDTNGVIINVQKVSVLDNVNPLVPLKKGQGYLMSCFKNSSAYVARLNMDLDTLWVKQYPLSGSNSAPYVFANIDTSQFLLVPTNGDSTIASIDENGNLLWRFKLKRRFVFFSSVPNEDGGFTIGGASSTSDSTSASSLLKVSSSGDSLWFRQYYPQLISLGDLPAITAWWSMKGTLDKGFVSVGMITNANDYLGNGWISKVDCMGNDSLNLIPPLILDCSSLNTSIKTWVTEVGEISIYPNPFSENTTITYIPVSAKKARLNIFDIRGSFVKSFTLDKDQSSLSISSESLSNGVYFADLNLDGVSIAKRKFVVIK